jgi:methylmalonyl-CoA/ethylmalonyl-CoA epimerase
MLNKIYHLGYAVEDIEAASRFYRENFSAEPTESEVVGEQGIIAAMFRVGESMVELVQPTGPDTPVGRFLARRGEGFHHVAYEVDDLEAALRELKQNGVEIIDEEPRVGAGDTRMAFVHPRSTFGVLTELVELPKRGG